MQTIVKFQNATGKAPSYDPLQSWPLPASVFSWSVSEHAPFVSLSDEKCPTLAG